MPTISFDDAKDMVSDAREWMKSVSDYIQDPESAPKPEDIYSTQKLAFEIDLRELKEITDNCEKMLGILGYEANGSLSVILVGMNDKLRPSATVLPIETFPVTADMSELSTVLDVYLKP